MLYGTPKGYFIKKCGGGRGYKSGFCYPLCRFFAKFYHPVLLCVQIFPPPVPFLQDPCTFLKTPVPKSGFYLPPVPKWGFFSPLVPKWALPPSPPHFLVKYPYMIVLLVLQSYNWWLEQSLYYITTLLTLKIDDGGGGVVCFFTHTFGEIWVSRLPHGNIGNIIFWNPLILTFSETPSPTKLLHPPYNIWKLIFNKRFSIRKYCIFETPLRKLEKHYQNRR